MRPLTSILAALAIAWSIAGCQPQSSAPSSSSTTGSTPGGGTTSAPATTGTTGATQASASDADVPAELKATDAYKYYGLGNSQPVDLELVSSQRPDTITGTSTVKVKSVSNGEVTYNVERTGGMFENFGNEENVLKADGLHLTSTTKGELKSPTLQIPATLSPGTTWKVESQIEVPNIGTFGEKAEYKVVGTQPVKTKAGDYPDALLITSDGEVIANGQHLKTTGKQWLVAGKGLVRYEIRSIDPKSKKPTTMTIQETKGE